MPGPMAAAAWDRGPDKPSEHDRYVIRHITAPQKHAVKNTPEHDPNYSQNHRVIALPSDTDSTAEDQKDLVPARMDRVREPPPSRRPAVSSPYRRKDTQKNDKNDKNDKHKEHAAHHSSYKRAPTPHPERSRHKELMPVPDHRDHREPREGPGPRRSYANAGYNQKAHGSGDRGHRHTRRFEESSDEEDLTLNDDDDDDGKDRQEARNRHAAMPSAPRRRQEKGRRRRLLAKDEDDVDAWVQPRRQGGHHAGGSRSRHRTRAAESFNHRTHYNTSPDRALFRHGEHGKHDRHDRYDRHDRHDRYDEYDKDLDDINSDDNSDQWDRNHHRRRSSHRHRRPSPSRSVRSRHRGDHYDDDDDNYDENKHRQHQKSGMSAALGRAAKNAVKAGTMAALSKAPGDWIGEKGSHVATAALGAALVDTFMSHTHPNRFNGILHTAMRSVAERTIKKVVTEPIFERAARHRRGREY